MFGSIGALFGAVGVLVVRLMGAFWVGAETSPYSGQCILKQCPKGQKFQYTSPFSPCSTNFRLLVQGDLSACNSSYSTIKNTKYNEPISMIHESKKLSCTVL